MNALPRLFIGIALATCAVATPAGTRQASFDIVINLHAYPTGTTGPGGGRSAVSPPISWQL